jgi:hypothetical protein
VQTLAYSLAILFPIFVSGIFVASAVEENVTEERPTCLNLTLIGLCASFISDERHNITDVTYTMTTV